MALFLSLGISLGISLGMVCLGMCALCWWALTKR
jgi:hypothetical protein